MSRDLTFIAVISDCSWFKLADFGEVLTRVEQSWGLTFITICHDLGVFIPLKGDILMSLFLLKNFFLWSTKCPSLPLRKDDKKKSPITLTCGAVLV